MRGQARDPFVEMLFEHTMQLFFGKKANHIAGQINSPRHRREWLGRVVRVLLKRIDALETTPRHRQLLMANVEAIDRILTADTEPSWELVFGLFAVIGRLLGFDFEGARCHSLAYFQTPSQHFTTDLLENGQPTLDAHAKQDAITIRSDVIALLKQKGLSDFKIALVLSTTEYEVKKLRKGLATTL